MDNNEPATDIAVKHEGQYNHMNEGSDERIKDVPDEAHSVVDNGM